MKKNLTGIFIAFLQSFWHSPTPSKPDSPVDKKQQGRGTRSVKLKKCYYCGGSGLTNHSSKLDAFESPQIWGERSMSTFPYNQCPLCRGTGFVEAVDGEEDP